MRKNTESFEKLEAQQAHVSEKTQARKEHTAARYKMLFVEKMGNKTDPRPVAKLSTVIAATGAGKAISHLS